MPKSHAAGLTTIPKINKYMLVLLGYPGFDSAKKGRATRKVLKVKVTELKRERERDHIKRVLTETPVSLFTWLESKKKTPEREIVIAPEYTEQL